MGKTKGKRIKTKSHAATNQNDFERISNKKRFDVLGRKTKGEIRNIGRLRSAATEKVTAKQLLNVSCIA